MGTPILETEKGTCYECHKQGYTELHHIYFGPGRRKISDKNGFVVYLCHECHQGTTGVHGRDGDELDEKLKRECQQEYEKNHSRSEFMKLIGKNYL